MNLLMDALKKAEEFRRMEKAIAEGQLSIEETASTRPEPKEESPFKLKLKDEPDSDSISENTDHPTAVIDGQAKILSSPGKKPATDPGATELLNNTNWQQTAVEDETPEEPGQQQDEYDNKKVAATKDAAQAIDDLLMEAGDKAGQATIDSMKGVHSMVIQSARGQSSINCEAPALQEENPQCAQRLFKDREPAKRNRLLIPIILSSSLVLLLLAGSAGYLWLANELNRLGQYAHINPSTNNAQTIPIIESTILKVPVASDTGHFNTIQSRQEDSLTTEQKTAIEQLRIAKETSATKTSILPESILATETTPTPQTGKDAISTVAEPGLSTDRIHAPQASMQSLIQVNRGASRVKLDKRLQQAWEAYQSGDLQSANQLYSRVLLDQPTSRSALLGMATLAKRNNDLSEARKYYIRMLERNPGDPLAHTGLISLFSRKDSVAGISRINLLLEDYPRLPTLHFTLGNLYARQARWTEARRAYFTAWSIDNSNPDYAYNVAIALDHLGKYPQAMSFYKQSMSLAASHHATFSTNATSQRMQEIDARYNVD